MGVGRGKINIVGGQRRLRGNLFHRHRGDVRRDNQHVGPQNHHRIHAVAEGDRPRLQFITHALGLLAVGTRAVPAHGHAHVGRHDAHRPARLQLPGRIFQGALRCIVANRGHGRLVILRLGEIGRGIHGPRADANQKQSDHKHNDNDQAEQNSFQDLHSFSSRFPRWAVLTTGQPAPLNSFIRLNSRA